MSRLAVVVAVACLVASAFAQGQGAPQDPPFIASASPAVKASFYAVVQANANQPEEKADAAVEAWVALQSPTIQAAFKQFQAMVDEQERKEEAAHQAALARLSAGARAADAQLTAIASQNGLSGQQKAAAIKKTMDSLPSAVRKELLAALNGGR